jgi:predicted thioesterase
VSGTVDGGTRREPVTLSDVPFEVGQRGEARLVVSDADTAIAMRSGDVPVLATPRVIALCEEATVVALAGRLPAGCTTVGMRVQVDHLQPTCVGGEVVAEAVLEKVEGRRLTFTVSASDDRGLVAAGRVTRVQVEVDRFLGKS